MIKAGDKVVCVDAGHHDKYLTNGSIYVVNSIDVSTLDVISNAGYAQAFFKERFEKAPEYVIIEDILSYYPIQD